MNQDRNNSVIPLPYATPHTNDDARKDRAHEEKLENDRLQSVKAYSEAEFGDDDRNFMWLNIGAISIAATLCLALPRPYFRWVYIPFLVFMFVIRVRRNAQRFQ